jgi:hypothetical protein
MIPIPTVTHVNQATHVTQGSLRTAEGRALPLVHTDVRTTIAGPVARVEVSQVFQNDTGGPIEAVYSFPLPHAASVHTMRFRIGERVVNGAVKEKEEARRAYDAARREGRSATLLEQETPSLFTLSVANVPPGERIEVTLGYQERLAFDDGVWRFVFPMVAPERYEPDPPPHANFAPHAPPQANVNPTSPSPSTSAPVVPSNLPTRRPIVSWSSPSMAVTGYASTAAAASPIGTSCSPSMPPKKESARRSTSNASQTAWERSSSW